MPKETINIKTFNGMIGSVDAHDAPAGSAVFAENIDNIQQQGLFTPLPKDVSLGAGTHIANCDLVTPFSDGSLGVVYDQSNNNVAVIGLDSGTQTASVSKTRYGGLDTAISDGEAAHVGLGADQNANPVWVGEIFHGQFSGSAPSNIQFEDAEIKWAECVGIHTDNTAAGSASATTAFMLPSVKTTNSIDKWDNSQVVFRSGSSYYYYASLVYDGFQEGPLFLIGNLSVSDTAIQLVGTGTTAATELEADDF